MSDRPWLEENDPALRSERELLKRLNAEQPPAGSVDRGWAALAAEIAVLGAAGTATASAAAAGPAHGAQAGGVAGAGLAAKVAVGAALAGGTLWGGATLLAPQDTQPSGPPNIPAATTPAKPLPDVRPPVAAEPPPGNPPPADPARPGNPATTLAEEGRLLAKAHQLVQAGQGREALEILRASAARYPRSVLYQEREVLTIEALDTTGAFGAAKVRAERFLRRYPKSPHAGRLQRFVE